MDERPEEWLIAIGLDRTRRYLIHTWEPIFLCEVLAEGSADEGKFSYSLGDGRLLSNILFLDDFPPEDEWAALIASASAAISRFDGVGVFQ